MGEAFAYHLGAAFLVSAARIRLRGLATWQRIYSYLQKPPDAANLKRPGKNCEMTWHLLFGEGPRMRPPSARRLCPKDPLACLHKPMYPAFLHGEVYSWYVRA